MNREIHVRFWEGVGLRCPALLAYLKAYESVAQARRGLSAYFEFYNHQRLHQTLGYRAPQQLLERVAHSAEPAATHEFLKASGIYCVAFRIGWAEVLVVKLPSGHAMSSRRLFLSGLLSSRARLRWPALTYCPTAPQITSATSLWLNPSATGTIRPELGRISYLRNARSLSERSGPLQTLGLSLPQYLTLKQSVVMATERQNRALRERSLCL